MKSPFPGMDPYLEQYWRDVHHSLCTYARDALQPQLRPALLAQIDERLIIETPGDDDRNIYPDLRVVEESGEPQPISDQDSGGVAIAEPALLIKVDSETPTEGFVNIVDPADGHRLVTVIEFLSPSNKRPGDAQAQYRKKQQELRETGVSLVEVDLVRIGGWVVQAPKRMVPRSYQTLYRVCVHRGWRGQEFEFYRVRINQRLSMVNVPLREKDPDAKLNLQTLLDQTYQNGAYDRIDYRQPPVPPLDENSARWVEQFIKPPKSSPN